MTEKSKFKKLPSIKNLSIPQHSSNDAPYSPGYKRFSYSGEDITSVKTLGAIISNNKACNPINQIKAIVL